VLASSSSSTGGSSSLSPNITCRPVNTSALIFCAGRVNWLVQSNWDDATQDIIAELESDPNNLCCPFYVSNNYQCIKHFPRCEMVTINGTQVAQITKICASACWFGPQYMNGQCSNCASDFFTNECSDSTYYASPPAPCQDAGNFDTGHNNETWKWVLVGIMSAIGLAIFLYWLRLKCRERMSDEELDSEYAKKQRNEQLKHADRYEDVAEEDHSPVQVLGRGHPPTAEELKAIELANKQEAEQAAAANSNNNTDNSSSSGTTNVAPSDIPFVAMTSSSSSPSEEKS